MGPLLLQLRCRRAVAAMLVCLSATLPATGVTAAPIALAFSGQVSSVDRVWTQVPEPALHALLGIAFIAGSIAARRVRPARPPLL